MTLDVRQAINQLQHRRENPEQAIIAATLLGYQARPIREEIENQDRTLASIDNAVVELSRTLWDMNVVPIQRAAAAWSLGQIGGLQPTIKLLDRLDNIFVSYRAKTLRGGTQDNLKETNDVCAVLVKALAQALDASVEIALKPFSLIRQQLYQVCKALLNYIQPSDVIDPDLSTAIAMALAKLALRDSSNLPSDTMRRLLTASSPIATIAAMSALSELISVKGEEEASDLRSYAFSQLGNMRGQQYDTEERKYILHLAELARYAERNSQLAGNYLWEKVHST